MKVAVVTAVVLVFAFNCRGDEPRDKAGSVASPGTSANTASLPPPPMTTTTTTAAAPPVPPAASGPPAPTATVELPPRGFTLADVLGKPKREVDRALGHNEQLEDGPWQYDGFGKVGVLVVYEAGRAVFVSVQAPEFHNSAADRAAVLAWMQAPDDVDLDHTQNFDFELGVWAPGAQDRQLARRALAQRVTDGLKSSVGGFASSTYTWLEVTLHNPDACTQAFLGRIAKVYELKSAGFDVMECVNDTNTKVHLR